MSNWSAQYFEDRAAPLEVAFDLKNTGSKPLDMVDGSLWFYDALGREIVGVGLPDDIDLPAGGTSSFVQRGFGAKALRLVELQSGGSVKVSACIDQVLYSDGTVEKFE